MLTFVLRHTVAIVTHNRIQLKYIYTATWLPVLQVLPVHPAVHLQTLGATQVPPLWQTEHTAVMNNDNYIVFSYISIVV